MVLRNLSYSRGSEEGFKKSIRRLKELTIDERLAILGSIMDAIARIKIMLYMEATGCSEKEAINILRQRLMEAHEKTR